MSSCLSLYYFESDLHDKYLKNMLTDHKLTEIMYNTKNHNANEIRSIRDYRGILGKYYLDK